MDTPGLVSRTIARAGLANVTGAGGSSTSSGEGRTIGTMLNCVR